MFQMQLLSPRLLEVYEDNPREIAEKDFQQLCESLKSDKDYFTARPCLVNLNEDGKYIIYAGAQRFRAACTLGFTEIPCYVSEDLSEEVMRKRCLLDNHHAGRWDIDKLANHWDIDELKAIGDSFMKSLNIPDLNAILEEAQMQGEAEAETEKATDNGYVIKYEIIFDTEEQQAHWYELLAYLKAQYSDCNTIAERIDALSIKILKDGQH